MKPGDLVTYLNWNGDCEGVGIVVEVIIDDSTVAKFPRMRPRFHRVFWSHCGFKDHPTGHLRRFFVA